MKRTGAHALVHGTPGLPSLPELHSRMLAVLADPAAGLRDLVPLVNLDPGLAARLIKRSNSAYFGRSSEIGSVIAALEVLGLADVREVILLTTVLRVFDRMPQYLLDVREFWRHSASVGILARKLALECGLPAVDEVHAAGLLHDVGRLVMVSLKPVEYHSLMLLARATQTWLGQLESEHLGYTHCEVGGALFEAWGFPAGLVMAARHHHQPTLADSNRELVCLVQMADVLTHGLEMGVSGESRIPPFDQGCWTDRQLTFAVLQRLMLETEAELAGSFDSLFDELCD